MWLQGRESLHQIKSIRDQGQIQDKGKVGVKVSRAKQCGKCGVTPTSGAVRLGKIPFSARGSPVLNSPRDCKTAMNSQLASLG